MNRLHSAALAVLFGLALALTPVLAHAAGNTATAHFVAGVTDDNRPVEGTVTFKQSASGAPITASGHLEGLAASTTYVTVPYKDGACIPAAGISAFPSGTFQTDANGEVTFSGVPVNPKNILPVGVFDVTQTHSVSVRQVLVQGLVIKGLIGTPTIPNVAYTEACDKNPEIT